MKITQIIFWAVLLAMVALSAPKYEHSSGIHQPSNRKVTALVYQNNRLDLTVHSKAEYRIVNALGRIFQMGHLGSGNHSLIVPRLSRGVYFVQLKVNGQLVMKQFVVR